MFPEMDDTKQMHLPPTVRKHFFSNRSLQYLAAAIVTFNLFNNGMHYGWPSPSLPKLLSNDSNIHMTNADGSWLAVTILLGSIVGSCLATFLLNAIGRKGTILLTSIPLFASWIMVAFAESLLVLIVARFFAGIAEGLSFCSSPTYIGEIADKDRRGLLGTILTTGSLLGIFVINIIGSNLSIRTTAVLCSVIPIVTFVSFLWMPESPYYLVMKNKENEAIESLRILKGVDDVQSEIDNIVKYMSRDTVTIERYWKRFTARSNLKALSIVLLIRAVQQCSGATALTFYAQTIFAGSADIISPATSSSIFFGTLVASTVVSSILVDKAGRRPLLIISTVGVEICLLMETGYFFFNNSTHLTILPAIGLIVFELFFGLGLQTLPLVVESEMFEAGIKALAVCVSDMMFCIIGAMASKLFQYMKDEFEIYVSFLIFSICTGIGLLLVICVVPETKGKTLEMIQIELSTMKGQTLQKCSKSVLINTQSSSVL